MALLSFRGISTPSLPAQGEQRRSSYFNIPRGNSLAQIFRLNKTVFTNKDVQLTFRVGAQSARTRIQSWENAGIIRFTGTRAAEGALGGKPANEYTIADARIERVMLLQLISYQDRIEEEAGFQEADEVE